MSDLLNSQGAQEQEEPYPDTKFTKFFGRLYAAVFALFAIAALSVFVLPENILDVSAACADFVRFMKRFFSKHRRNRQNKPAHAACGILRRNDVGTYFNGFHAKLRVLSDRHILIQKGASRRQDAAICDITRYTFRLLGIKQLFLRRFCRKRHPPQSR